MGGNESAHDPSSILMEVTSIRAVNAAAAGSALPRRRVGTRAESVAASSAQSLPLSPERTEAQSATQWIDAPVESTDADESSSSLDPSLHPSLEQSSAHEKLEQTTVDSRAGPTQGARSSARERRDSETSTGSRSGSRRPRERAATKKPGARRMSP